MPIETNALARRAEPEASDEDDFQAVCAALSSSTRGRWFLDEYARRNRNADTLIVLAALERMEARIVADGLAVERLHDDLRALLAAVRQLRPDSGAADAAEEPAKLAGLLNLLEHRIDTLVEVPPNPPPATGTLGTHTMSDEAEQETTRVHLTVVPPSEEPELPIPSPTGAQAPEISLVATAAIMPSPFDGTLPTMAETERTPATAHKKEPALSTADVASASTAEDKFWMHSVAELMPPVHAEIPRAAETVLPAVQLEIETEVRTEARAEVKFEIQVEAVAPNEKVPVPAEAEAEAAPAPDPLAALLALSQDERVALFT